MWTAEYFFTELKAEARCLVCGTKGFKSELPLRDQIWGEIEELVWWRVRAGVRCFACQTAYPTRTFHKTLHIQRCSWRDKLVALHSTAQTTLFSLWLGILVFHLKPTGLLVGTRCPVAFVFFSLKWTGISCLEKILPNSLTPLPLMEWQHCHLYTLSSVHRS